MAGGSTRQSLKVLQERLASRLATAQVSGADAAWLAVELRGQRALLPLVHSGEIFSVPVIQRVPHTQPWFMGVAALRGGLMGVVDLGAMLMPELPALPVLGVSEAKLVALHPSLGVNAALWVDRLLGLRGASLFTAVEQPVAGSLPAMGQVLTDAQGQRWQEINLHAVAEWPEFLSVAA